jgi:hypothetical protein
LINFYTKEFFMKKVLSVFLVCVALQAAPAQESGESTVQGHERLGLTLGAGVTLSDVMDETIIGIKGRIVFDKTLGGLHLYGDVNDKVLNDDTYDLMRQTHFEEEIGYRFGINQTAGIGVFVNNINNIYVMAMPGMSPGTQMSFNYFEGLAEPGIKFDGAFPFGMIQASVGIPVVYRQQGGAPDTDTLASLHPEISWQSNFGLGLYGGVSFAFPPGDHKELITDAIPFERTEWKISYMTRSFYAELWLYTTLDFEKVNICPTVTYFTGSFSVWFSLEMGKINYKDFGVCPTAGVTYSF